MKYIVQAVPQRKHLVDTLVARLPGAQVYYDLARQPTRALAASLLLAGDEPHIHFEDDAHLRSDFVEAANEAIRQYPDRVINFFPGPFVEMEWSKPQVLAGQMFTCLQASYMPAGIGWEFYEWCVENNFGLRPQLPKRKWDGMDLSLGQFLKDTKRSWVRWWPALAQHQPVKSVIDPGRPIRMTNLFHEPEA